MTLLLRRPERERDYRAKGSVLRLTTHNMTEARHGFEVEAMGWKDPSQPNPLPSVEQDGRNHGDRLISQREPSGSQTKDPLFDVSDPELEAESTVTNASPSLSEDRQTPDHNAVNLTSHRPDNKQTFPFPEPMDESANDVNVDLGQNQLDDNSRSKEKRDGMIYHAHRLTPQSTILFLQNGMGMIDEVNREIFPSEKDRPYYMVGILSHGLYNKGPFDIIHAGEGTIALGLSSEEKQYPASARYLLRTMTRTPVFVAVGFNPIDLLQHQLDKLAVNAVVNPLTTILDCLNGELLNNSFVTRVMRLLLAEISVVFRSLPELKNVPNVNMRFDTARLESMVVRVIKLTGLNQSSMLQDIRKGRQTEIEYINGYIVKRGEELGIHCVTNYTIMQIVRAKDRMNQQELGRTVPLQPSIRRE